MKPFGTLVLMIAAGVVHAAPQVVGGAACPLYAVDIEAFATCDGNRVAALNRLDLDAALIAESQVAIAKRTVLGLYVDAQGAYRLKEDNPNRVVLVDIRSPLDAALTGQPAVVDAQVPYVEPLLPLAWNSAAGGWAMTHNAGFANALAAQLDKLGVARDAPILLLCAAGEQSASAVAEIAALGYTRVISIVDGFEGDRAADGQRTVNGWKNAGLPYKAAPVAKLVRAAG